MEKGKGNEAFFLADTRVCGLVGPAAAHPQWEQENMTPRGTTPAPAPADGVTQTQQTEWPDDLISWWTLHSGSRSQRNE